MQHAEPTHSAKDSLEGERDGQGESRGPLKTGKENGDRLDTEASLRKVSEGRWKMAIKLVQAGNDGEKTRRNEYSML